MLALVRPGSWIEVWYSVVPLTVIGALTELLLLLADDLVNVQPDAPLGVPHLTAPFALTIFVVVSKVT